MNKQPIQKLIGFRLESCRFSLGSYSFEFSGQIDGEYKTYDVSTSDFACALPRQQDAEHEISTDIWSMLEKNLTSIQPEQSDKSSRIIFEFENHQKLTIWTDPPQEDNLLIVRERSSGEWFPVL